MLENLGVSGNNSNMNFKVVDFGESFGSEYSPVSGNCERNLAFT